MHRPRKATYDVRVLLSQEIRTFLEPELDAPPGSWRRVQLLIPQSPEVYLGIDQKPEALGLNRNYKLPLYPPGAQITVALLPHQFLSGCAGIATAKLSMIVEHFGGE
jgi:hypothetical protein